jgi:hypothetical protein|tara:strand:+ start:581 stop:784 length:204 start_codon:yes stop_codon:yes gene_type:complete
MNINSEFADIVHNSLVEVDELGDDILLEETLLSPKIYQDQMPPLVFPFGYMIISSTFMFYDEEEEDE